ncbi:hypothetical protein QJQ45_001603 [Haematococcus lacustris]|nr:hypothetical protein QJQ45_001603 [Haematococcus lacustris]
MTESNTTPPSGEPPTETTTPGGQALLPAGPAGAEASPLAGAPVSTGPTLPPVSGASPLANLPGLSTAQTAALVNQLLSKILAAPEALALFKPVEDAAQAAAKAQPAGTTAPASYVDALLTPPPANTSTAHAEEAARLRLQLNAVTASMEAAQTEAATLRSSIAELDRIHGQADAVVSARLRMHVSRAATLEAMLAAAGQDLRAGITPMQPDAQRPIGPGRLDLVPAQVSRAITAGTQATSACRLLPVGMVMVGMVMVVEGMVARVVVAAAMVVVMVVAVAMEVVAATHPGVPSSLTAKCELLVMPEMFSAFDVLMGSNWLTANGALLDYLTRTVTMQLSNRHGTHTISASRAASWLRKGGHALVAMISAEQLNTPDSVPPVVSTKLKDLINEYSDVFAPFNGLPPERPIGHTIPLQPGCKPPALPAYRMTQPELAEMKKQITAFLAQGIIEPSSSPYAAPVLFVKKKSGELRMCVDYRQLNKQTLRDQYPLPRIDDLFDKLAGCTVFSSLDLQAGYHQIRIPAEDVPKTAFRTPDGHYQYKVLCFGLTNAPATFQRVMNDSFADVINDCALVYLDDILVMSKTVDEHFVHLRRVLDLLRKHKFFAKLSKCEFMKTALKFLGHIVSDRGVAVDPDKIQSITTWPVPNSLTALQRFLGAANFVRKFVHNFSALAAPLTDLTGKEAPPPLPVHPLHHVNMTEQLLAGYRNDPVFADISITDTYDVDEHGLYHTKDKKQIVVPDCPELRARILLEMHDAQFAGHVGITKTLERISRVFWWPRMRSEVRHYVANCDACQRNKSVNTKPGGLLMPLAIPYDRWESITMDLITKLPTGDHGYDAIAVFVDRLSKMVHFVPCKESMNAKGFARLFIDNVFKHHGVPREIISDRGSHFTNQFWSSILKLLGVKECKSSAYHPESDGQTERYNRTLEEMMRHYISPAQHDWPLHLALAEFAVNNSWQESIQSTPFLLNIIGSKLLEQIRDAMQLLTTARVIKNLMRGPMRCIAFLPPPTPIEEVLAAKMHDLEEKHQHLQAAHRQLRLDNESLEAVIEQCNLAVTIARRDVHRLEAQLCKFQRRPLLTRKQRQQLQILKQTGVSIEVLRRWADSNCSRLDTHGRPGGTTVQPTPRPSPPEPTPGPSPPEPCDPFIPTQEASPGQPAARTAAYTAQQYLSTARLMLKTQVSRRRLSTCRRLFITEQCVVANTHRHGERTTVSRQLSVVYKYLRQRTLAGGQGGAGHKLDTQEEGVREGSDPTCRARGYWATSVAAVGRGEARMSRTGMSLNIKI